MSMDSNDAGKSGNEPDYQAAYRKRLEELQKQQEQDAQVKSLLKQLLEPAAYERLLNVKLSNPELYSKIVQMLAMLYQQGRLKSKVDEPTLKALLSKIIGQKHEGSISFQRK